MAASSLTIPVLANNPGDRLGHIKGTIAEAKAEVAKLRTRTVGHDVPVVSQTAEQLHFLLIRLSGEINRLGLVL